MIPLSFALLLFSSPLSLNFQDIYAQTPNSMGIFSNNGNTNNTLKPYGLVNFASNEYQIRGYLNASFMNKVIGNETLALAHASHTVAEVYSLIARPVGNAKH